MHGGMQTGFKLKLIAFYRAVVVNYFWNSNKTDTKYVTHIQ